MDVMAGETAQSSSAFQKAPAELHGEMVFQEIGSVHRRSARGWNLEYRHGLVKRFAGLEIRVLPSWQEHARIAVLMASHADVFSEARGKLGWVDDATFSESGHMRLSGT